MKNIVKYTSSSPSTLFSSFAEQLGAEIKNNSFKLPDDIGSGYGNQYEIERGLVLTIFDFNFIDDYVAIREPNSLGDFYPIITWYSEGEISQEINGESKVISKYNQNGIFFPSPKTTSKYTIPKKTRIYVITIAFSKEWLTNNYTIKSENYFNKLMNSDKMFFLFEEISIIAEIHLKEILNSEPNRILKIKAAVLLYIDEFLNQIEKRHTSSPLVNLNQNDVKQIFEIRKRLIEEYNNPPNIKVLAAEYYMSESKLTKLFKHVFGMPIYQFIMRVKINEAKQLLETKQYTISEVGYKIGYSNLSHFANAFRKQYGITPKKYVLGLK